MGLDMYAYSASSEDQYENYWSNYYCEDSDIGKSVCSKPKELAYWRKHPNLHGWMENLWESKCDPSNREFNGIQLELTWEDIHRLEEDIKNKQLPATSGFFFGSDADAYYYEQDLNFIKEAKADLFLGLKVFYNSSW